jgi:hypothetical protein
MVGTAVDKTRHRARGQLGARGPESVLASLRRGLTALRLPFDLNPRGMGSAKTVGVLSDLEALEAGIAWRQQARDRRLIAGPNLVVLPSDAESLMTADEVDLCLVPSEWVKRHYEDDAPALRNRIAVWPAGVDADYWRPRRSRGARPQRALMLRKTQGGQQNPSDSDIRDTRDLLHDAGFEVSFFEYGSFRQRQYRKALREVDLVVYFSPTESQGLAMVEAWAVDVPTFVWSCGRLRYRERETSSSSSPYLTDETGRFFEDARALRKLLASWETLHPTFRPREWVLHHMTDAICGRAYWELAHGLSEHALEPRGSVEP